MPLPLLWMIQITQSVCGKFMHISEEEEGEVGRVAGAKKGL